MMKLQNRLSLLWRQIKLPIMIFLFMSFLVSMVNNLRQGYFIVPPFQIETPISWEVFQSDSHPISLPYPSGWSAHNTLGGYRGDKEAIANIRVTHYDYPYVFIAHQKIPNATIEQVAAWGLQRLKLSIAKDSTCETVPFDEITIDGTAALSKNCKYYATNSQRINCQHVYLLKSDDAYIVEFYTNEKNDSPELRGVFQHMITNLSISK